MIRTSATEQTLARIDEGDAAPRQMVWGARHTNPLTGILTANPDLGVLIVDDFPAMRSLIRSVLVSFGVFNVQEAASGSEGLDCLRRQMPNIAIVDYDMAPMGGLEFVRHVRRDPDSPDPSLPIVMMTGIPSQRQVLEIRDVGATDILSKPFAPSAFAQHVASILVTERKFIQSAAYCGPDRRRRQAPFIGIDRRRPIDVRPETPPQQNVENIFWV